MLSAHLLRYCEPGSEKKKENLFTEYTTYAELKQQDWYY
jgi:hypothetical protein